MSVTLGKDTETALYAICDTLAMDMQQKGFQAVANYTRNLKCGPLKLRADVRARADYLGSGVAAVLVHMKGHLWAYVVAHYRGANDTKLWMVLFNGNSFDFPDFKMGKVKATLDAIGGKAVGCYEYTGQSWKSADEGSILAGDA